jgi:hypothetical protein
MKRIILPPLLLTLALAAPVAASTRIKIDTVKTRAPVWLRRRSLITLGMMDGASTISAPSMSISKCTEATRRD